MQNPNDQTAEDFSNVRCNTCRTFKKKKCDYMKEIVNKLKENSKNKNIWEMYKGISELKKRISKGYCAFVIKKDSGTIVPDT